MTDAEIVRRVLAGDPSAFTTLVDRHAAACLRFAARMLGDEQDAEDATQEALLRAYRALGRYEERQQFRPWLFEILVNRCRTMLRRRQLRARFLIVSDDAVRRSGAGVAPSADVADSTIGHALATLDAPLREAFLLKHVEDLSYLDMAAITGASVSALKMRVKRARSRLQEALRDVEQT